MLSLIFDFRGTAIAVSSGRDHDDIVMTNVIDNDLAKEKTLV